MKVLALDYGPARTGVAVSDPTGTVARPLGVVARAATAVGVRRILDLARSEDVERILVGLPLTLRGERGSQVVETERFVEALRDATDLPVETYDERFTTRLAAGTAGTGGSAPEGAPAASPLLTGYLLWVNGSRP